MKKILPASIFVAALGVSGTSGSAKNYRVEYVARSAAFLPDQKSNPWMLVVKIAEDGRLSPDEIETGTITDPALLSEKPKVIFEDRETSSIRKRKVLIDPQGRVRNEDLKKLVETLASIKASPIKVIKNNL